MRQFALATIRCVSRAARDAWMVRSRSRWRFLQDFVGSVSALLRVRQGTVSLKHRVVELNEEVQKSGGGVADKVRRWENVGCERALTAARG